MLNPYKKIEQLKEKIKKLEQENKYLLEENKKAEKMKLEYGLKIKSANDKELEYLKLSNELEEIKKEYQKLLHQMKFKINKIEGTYKKAMDNIVDDLKNNG